MIRGTRPANFFFEYSSTRAKGAAPRWRPAGMFTLYSSLATLVHRRRGAYFRKNPEPRSCIYQPEDHRLVRRAVRSTPIGRGARML